MHLLEVTCENVSMRAHVVHETEVRGRRTGTDTAEVRVTLDSAVGSDRLEQRVIRFARGKSQPQSWTGCRASSTRSPVAA